MIKYRIVTKKRTLEQMIKVWEKDPSKHVDMRHPNYSLTFHCDKEMDKDYYMGYETDAFTYFKLQHQVPDKPFVFVAMPFSDKIVSINIYEQGIKEAIEQSGYKCVRIDNNYLSLPIIDKIFSHILNCEFVIADLTGSNPNVFYELGLAHSLNKKVIQISQKIADSYVPFDVSNIYTIFYSNNDVSSLMGKLLQSIVAHKEDNKL